MGERITRDVRLLKGYAVIMSVAVGVLMLGAFTQKPDRTRFDEIDVERINVIEKNGQIRLVIANRAKTPGPIEKGVPFGYPAGRRVGMIFYNDEGTENGGLIFSGRTVDGKVESVGSLTFDQYNQDQTVALQHVESNNRRRSGLQINDLPTNASGLEVSRKREEIMKIADSVQRTTALAALRREYPFTSRAYFGKSFDGASVVTLADARGKVRLRMVVDSAGPAKIEFLNDSGRVVHAIPSP